MRQDVISPSSEPGSSAPPFWRGAETASSSSSLPEDEEDTRTHSLHTHTHTDCSRFDRQRSDKISNMGRQGRPDVMLWFVLLETHRISSLWSLRVSGYSTNSPLDNSNVTRGLGLKPSVTSATGLYWLRPHTPPSPSF